MTGRQVAAINSAGLVRNDLVPHWQVYSVCLGRSRDKVSRGVSGLAVGYAHSCHRKRAGTGRCRTEVFEMTRTKLTILTVLGILPQEDLLATWAKRVGLSVVNKDIHANQDRASRYPEAMEETLHMSRKRLIISGFLAVFCASGLASASASASGPYVYAKGGANPLMGSLELQVAQVNNVVINGTLAGTPIEVICGLVHSSSSTLENVLTAGIEHTLGLFPMHYTMCSVAKPAGKGCLIQNELLLVNAHILAVNGPLVHFTPEGGNVFTTLTLDGCSAEALDKGFSFEGSLSALPNNTNSTLEFTLSSGSHLKFGGNAAVFQGTFKVEMLSGGELEFR